MREVSATRDIPVKTLPCRVSAMTRLAPDVMALRLKLPSNERLLFLADRNISDGTWSKTASRDTCRNPRTPATPR